MEEEVNNQTSQEENASEGKPNKDVSFPRRKEKKGSKKGLRILIIVIVIFLIGAGYFILTGPSIEKEVEVTPTPVREISPTPTLVVEEFVRDEVSINILNGTGIPGAAGDLRDEIEGLGYSNIEVGNAKSQDNISTEVVFDQKVSGGVINEITDLLESIYKDVEVSSDSLDSIDIQITTGYPRGHTVTPTDTPKNTATPTADLTGTATPTASPTSSPTPTP